MKGLAYDNKIIVLQSIFYVFKMRKQNSEEDYLLCLNVYFKIFNKSLMCVLLNYNKIVFFQQMFN